MTKSASVISLASLLAFLTISEARAEDMRNFWLLNNTGRTINSVYFRAHGTFGWGNDAMLNAVLPDQLGTKVAFFGGYACNVDFKVVYADGSAQTYTQGRNLCSLTAIQLLPNTNTALTSHW
jgi:hypothetical protein